MTEILEVSMREYNAIKAERSTRLKPLINGTPLDYKHQLEEDVDTAIFRQGRITHALMAGSFDEEFGLSRMGCGRRDKRFKSLAMEVAPRELITEYEYEAGIGASEALKNNPIVKEFLSLSDVRHEMSAVMVDPETGIRWKTRPDLWSESESIVLDVKTTNDINAAMHQIKVLSYDMQLAMQVRGFGVERAGWLYVESKPPYKTRVIMASQSRLNVGWWKFHYALRTLKKCQDSGEWPGLPVKVETSEASDREIEEWAEKFESAN